jgi:hypothetical protein
MKTFDDMQTFGKQGYEAALASTAAMTKGHQAVAQEVAEFAKKSFEMTSSHVEKAMGARSFERVIEVQQGYAKDAYEAFMANATKIGEIYAAAAKEAFKPYEANFAGFGVAAAPAKAGK